MKTTVEISSVLLEEARKVAARDHTTLRFLIEEGFRQVLASRQDARDFRLRKATFKGEGLQPGTADATWERIGDPAYAAHGA
jgi:hypothetical protein